MTSSYYSIKSSITVPIMDKEAELTDAKYLAFSETESQSSFSCFHAILFHLYQRALAILLICSNSLELSFFFFLFLFSFIIIDCADSLLMHLGFLPLVAASRGYSLVAVDMLLMAVAFLVVELRL